MKTIPLSGRDVSVICKALAYAILVIEDRPVEHRETSDKNDMKEVLKTLAKSSYGLGYFMENARSHLKGERFDMVNVASVDDSNVVSMLDHLKNEVKGK